MSRELVVTFHGIGQPPAHVSEAERPYWMPKDDFEAFIADAGIVNAGANARKTGVTLVATFDDGNRSDLDVAAPLLARHGIRGIFFPCAGRIGHPDYLDDGDIRALAQEGFEIGSHGMDHAPWTGLGGAALAREIVDSRTILQGILSREVRFAALPFGAYDRRVLAAVRAAGYSAIYSSDSGVSRSDGWFRRRWSYREDVPFEFGRMAAVSVTLRHRLITGSKGLLKSLR